MEVERCRACGDTHPGPTEVCPRAGGSPRVGPCGTRIDRYEIDAWLGGGGMGAVYRARHAMIGQTVAIKLLHPWLATDADVVARFLRKARSAAAAVSPHIVRVSDFGVSSEGTPFLVMEFLQGETLDAMLARAGRIPPARALSIGSQMLAGLAAAHAAGVVHRDVKPANVLLVRGNDGNDGEPSVRLLDFGISKLRVAGHTAEATAAGVVMGTPAYMPPEQFLGSREVDARADVYAAAAVLYEMLSGARLFSDREANERFGGGPSRPRHSLAELCPDLSPSVLAAVTRALDERPDARFPDAGSFAAALRDAPSERFADPTLFANGRTPARSAVLNSPQRDRGGLQFDPTMAATPFNATRASAPMPAPRRGIVTAAIVLVAVFAVAVLATVLFALGSDTVRVPTVAPRSMETDEGTTWIPTTGDAYGAHLYHLRATGLVPGDHRSEAEIAAPLMPVLAACRLPGVSSRLALQVTLSFGRVTSDPIPSAGNEAPPVVLQCAQARVRGVDFGAIHGALEIVVLLDPT